MSTLKTTREVLCTIYSDSVGSCWRSSAHGEVSKMNRLNSGFNDRNTMIYKHSPTPLFIQINNKETFSRLSPGSSRQVHNIQSSCKIPKRDLLTTFGHSVSLVGTFQRRNVKGSLSRGLYYHVTWSVLSYHVVCIISRNEITVGRTVSTIVFRLSLLIQNIQAACLLRYLQLDTSYYLILLPVHSTRS